MVDDGWAAGWSRRAVVQESDLFLVCNSEIVFYCGKHSGSACSGLVDGAT